ncbi:MAG: HAMP domain-containing histidine kinase [Lachnospiraceae bacterium]|nr:HAMP domain-containing histidine kinase [Lachnospiraceae bacterium]
MKIRYFLLVYTAFMLAIFFYMYTSFANKPTEKRDMVFYNEQCILVSKQISQGRKIEEIEKEYGCEILLCKDSEYEMKLQDALQKEALLLDYFEKNQLAGKIVWNEQEQHYQTMEKRLVKQTVNVWGLVVFAGYLLIGLIYLMFIKPFHNLQKFSAQVAKGNLDFPLPVKKNNYFGAFTESFDIMREELKGAREREYQANQSKKELMAELSHDIKTPIATIQATCEVIQIKEKNPDTLEKVAVIDGKAKTIQKLIDNLFHATLEELAVLKVEPVEESALLVEEMFSKLQYYGEMHITGKVPGCLVYMDKLRLEQVIDNCLNNAWKYAGTPVHVTFIAREDGLLIKIKDQGPGVSKEELPLIIEKFYRGSNSKGREGSGLGLYLAKTFMVQMKGDMEYYNENGFVVELFLRKV